MSAKSFRDTSSQMAYKQQLTEPAAVLEYLKTCPIRAREVKRIQFGMVNFTYRLFLDQPIGQTQQKTAILKHTAPHVAADPDILFSAERQIYETRALAHVPWLQFSYQNVDLEDSVIACSGVTLPVVYFEDRENHVTIVQDCTPRLDEEGAWEQATNSFQAFLGGAMESEKKYQTAQAIGSMLGAFLAQLHIWGQHPDHHRRAVELFDANNQAKEKVLEVTFTDFFENISKTGYETSEEQRRMLALRIQELDLAARTRRDTVIMGDFWPGNVLVSFDKADRLSNMTVIDWEFVAVGPTFLDIGDFIGELFALSYFEGVDSSYATVLESFVQTYRTFDLTLDVKQTLGFAGAAILMSLPLRISSETSPATKDAAQECVEQALNFIIDPEFNYLRLEHGGQDSFACMARLMKTRQHLVQRVGDRTEA